MSASSFDPLPGFLRIRAWQSVFWGAAFILLPGFSGRAADGQIVLRADGADTLVQVIGDEDDDWRIETSTDLVNWSEWTQFGTLLSGDVETAPTRSVGSLGVPARFYRASRTAGLYDPALLRTIHLTFTQANWQTLLANGRNTGSNTVGSLTMDNGANHASIGARYRGNTSYSGFGGAAPTKKSLNIEFDFVDATGDLMGYETINLNNAYGDETIMREPLYFTVMRRYAVSPKGAMAKLHINGEYWGVYSLAQNEDGDLVREWFPSNDGDRWRAPNIGGGTGGGGGPGGGFGGGPGGGGGFANALSALSWQGANVATYQSYYELKKQNSTNAWENLVHAIDVLNNTPAAELRDKVEDVLAVDRWLWFLAVENIFADDDSYWNKGADYAFYYEPESGRIHPIEHDGNEAFLAGDVQLSPVEGAANGNRPVLSRLLPIQELRQRYLAHMRTVLEESFHPAALTPLIDQFHTLSADAVAADTKKGYTMTAYENDLAALKRFVTNRHNFLISHSELRPAPPAIVAVHPPTPAPTAAETPFITAEVRENENDGLNSVWLYYRGKAYGRFQVAQMFDDGAHGDGAAGDNVFAAAATTFPAGTKVQYYVEARSANAAKSASFSPPRAEEVTYRYQVDTSVAESTPVVINELMASNDATVADPQGEFDDWIELLNVTDQEVDLTGRYLSDKIDNPRKWQFPDGTKIPARGYLIVWADENGADTPGLHANFKLSAEGEQVLLVDTDENHNALLDFVTFGQQMTNRSHGRLPDGTGEFVELNSTPGATNSTDPLNEDL